MSSVTEKLTLIRFKVDTEPHISVDKAICSRCKEKTCVYVCPAECYTLVGDEIHFSHLGCLECGTCRLACDKGAIFWNYPKGGYGVCFRFV